MLWCSRLVGIDEHGDTHTLGRRGRDFEPCGSARVDDQFVRARLDILHPLLSDDQRIEQQWPP
jgi:hypothetical protein